MFLWRGESILKSILSASEREKREGREKKKEEEMLRFFNVKIKDFFKCEAEKKKKKKKKPV